MAGGIRTLVEYVMQDKAGDQGSFSKSIEMFHSKGYITPSDKELLDIILETGHASAHRQHKSDAEELRTALDIVEGLIARIYVHPDRGKRLAGRVPVRKKPAAKAKES